MRTAALVALCLVVIPAGVFVWAMSHSPPPQALHVGVGLARFSRVVKCLYSGDHQIAGCGWTSYGPKPPKLVLVRIEAGGCTQLADAVVCPLPGGHQCKIVVGHASACLRVIARGTALPGSSRPLSKPTPDP